MPSRFSYPATVNEILNDHATYKPDALRAVKRFRRSKPWRGTVEERKEKFLTLNRELALVYGIPEPRLLFVGIGEGPGNGLWNGRDIVLYGKLSVVTYLHEFGHARGWGERGACRWSVNLFRRLFPVSYSRCRHEGHTLRNPKARRKGRKQ